MSDALTIGNVREHIVGVDRCVPVLGGSSLPYVNFDNASSTPALRPVLDTILELLPWYSSVGRGTGLKCQLSMSALNEARRLVAQFVGASDETHVVIFGKNTTDAINKLAHSFPFEDGDIVLTSLMEHHSNILPWRQVADVRYIAVDSNGLLDMGHFKDLLAELTPRVRLVAITAASNVTGHINPIRDIAESAHQAGAKLFVDAAQLAPRRSIRMGPPTDTSCVDCLAYVAHKMYAPFGIGALVAPREIFANGDPDVVGGGAVDLVTTDSVRWTALPGREEAGTPNVIGAVAWGSAILALHEIGFQEIANHDEVLTTYFLSEIQKIDRVEVYGGREPLPSSTRLGVIPFAIHGIHHKLVAAILSCEAGIGVRSGMFCAHPYVFELLGTPAQLQADYAARIGRGSQPNLPGLTRVSFGIYNDMTEIDRLIDVVARISSGKCRGTYVQDKVSGGFCPTGHSHQHLQDSILADLRSAFALRLHSA